MTIILNKNVVLHGRAGPFYLERSFTSGFTRLQVALDHPLIWSVDWFKVKAGFYAIVDPTDPKEILYLGQKDFQDMIKVALSNREPLVVIARAGEAQPPASAILATKPNSPHSPVFFRTFRVYSKFLRALWSDMWEGRLVVPSDRNIRYIFCSWSRILLQWLGTRSKSRAQSQGFIEVSSYLLTILQSQGPLGLCIFLKTSLVVLNKYLAGEPLSNTWSLKCGMRMQGGLPAWFPLPIRLGIRDKSLKVIRLWSSILYTYKGIRAPIKEYQLFSVTHTPGLNDRAPSVKTWLWLFQDFIQNTYYPWLGWKRFDIPSDDGLPPLLSSAGPSGGTSIGGVLRDAWCWYVNRHSALRYSLNVVLNATGNGMALGALEHITAGSKPNQYLPHKIHKKSKVQEGYEAAIYDGRRPLALSRLHIIEEAAGKTRVIAIFDYFSQWAFRPIHNLLLKLLGTLYQDGTSDQNEGLERFRLRVKDRDGVFSSIDISSATDTIPWQLYEILLYGIFKDSYFARHYMRLLRRRTFQTPKVLPLEFVEYSKGQPMGALSSFPLLGMVHHALVQYSAYLADKFPFVDYCIVGDDLILFEEGCEIGNTPVSAQYYSMCGYLGIKINRSKTYESKTFFNFISRSFMGEYEVTPASMRSELSVHSLGQRVENTLRNASRWITGDKRSLIPLLCDYCLDPWRSAPFEVTRQYGFMTNYLALVLASISSPSSRFDELFGMKGLGWLVWLSSIRGTTIALSHAKDQLSTHLLRYNLRSTLTILRTAMLVLRSELESTLVSNSKASHLYPSWLVKQPRGVRVLYTLFRENRDRAYSQYYNMSSREFLPLLGYPVEDSSSLLDGPDYEIITGMSFDELWDGYLFELQLFEMGYMIPRRFIPSLRKFYDSWLFIFQENPDIEQLGHYIEQAFAAVGDFRPEMDYRDITVLTKVSRDELGRAPASSLINKKKFAYARVTFSDRLMASMAVAWKLMLASQEAGINPESILRLPPPTSSPS